LALFSKFMGLFPRRFKRIPSHFARLSSVGICLLACSVVAAPVLVDETPNNGDLPKDPWFYDVPVAIEVNTSAIEDFNVSEIKTQPETLNKRPVTHVVAQQGPAYSPRRSTPAESDGNFEQAEALRELLRSYLNTSKVVGDVVNQSVMRTVHRSPAVQGSDLSSAQLGLTVAGRDTVDEILAKAVSMVIQPGVSERGLMTFSILGLGEFTLIGGGSGVTLSLGDVVSFSVLGANSNSTLSDAFVGGGSAPDSMVIELGGLPTNLSEYRADSAIGASNGGASEGGGGESAEVGSQQGEAKPPQAQVGKPPLPRILVFAYKILTYPGTLLVLFFLLLVQMVKVGKRISRRTERRYSKGINVFSELPSAPPTIATQPHQP
jgi:hypothetical protein